jgi:4'-phosphopantetheinyl transferase
MLKHRNVSGEHLQFATTPQGKPYIVCPSIDPPIEYNITHDNNLVAMAFTSSNNIGIDVMKLRIPGQESLASFVDTLGDQVRSPLLPCAHLL